MDSIDKPLISIVIPIYNVEEFLKTCLSKVCVQTYTNVEILLIDDGSTDACPSICDEYAQLDNRITVVHKKNGGLSDARNVGIEISKGEYITFIDSDDFISEDYIEYLYSLIREANADISVCQVQMVTEDGSLIKTKASSKNMVVRGTKNCVHAFLYDNTIDTTAWRKLYKTSLFKDNNIKYPVGRYNEDVFTTYKLVMQSSVIAVGSRQLYMYRQRTGSITKSEFTTKHLDHVLGHLERYNGITQVYPEFKVLASKYVISSINKALLKMSKSKGNYNHYLEKFRKEYKKHIWNYMRSNASLVPKFFALGAFINIRFWYKCLRTFSKIH